ncbi:MAG: hypothetical protein J2P28_15920, partial [Actinobacteria bacterium]|nr:hypothetical protein [Actinomycetota bacterium]
MSTASATIASHAAAEVTSAAWTFALPPPSAALGVHQREPGLLVGELGMVLDADHLAVGEAVVDAADEQALQRAGCRRVVAGHHAHERPLLAQVDPAEPVALAPVDADRVARVPGLDVPGEAVVRLVVVLVGIDQLILRHCGLLTGFGAGGCRRRVRRRR